MCIIITVVFVDVLFLVFLLCLCSNVYCCFVNLYSVTNVISSFVLLKKYFIFLLFVFCIMVNFVKF